MENLSELLSDEDLIALTGYRLPSRQIEWLTSNGWKYFVTGANRPIVGRIYARLKLAGVKPTASHVVSEPWTLDLSKVK
ncbi:DUF4224 domain-containing protein [Pseudomonas turukhanskensis]|uniref:DUF4224 domain-containing protein n=1 Tax=Pseudomonas turukhanskensis TaxID=1806536 RepID=A0A9W6NET4_9PSED|nr:DUF4224 domain-containing protein [Pseudomonas turukhanskensis]GLK88303.1 hypothetical protein GCM10017655_13650 [Pseudomonas turukhanskensis]